MWRKHSCLPRRHSCRRSLPRARRSVELRLDAAQRSACATTAAVKLFLRCHLLITYHGSGDELLHFQKEIDFVAGDAQGSGYGGGRFAAALHT
jgi:hypothetical protein